MIVMATGLDSRCGREVGSSCSSFPHAQVVRSLLMYDYVLVGAGSAGCVLACRLTEDPAASVLLLEAGGPDECAEMRVPAAFSRLFKTECDWAYETEEQPHLNGRRLYWPRGKALGGSSAINAMIYIRGHPHDYDRWHDAGNKGWNFAAVLPYFKKAEHQERGPSEYHGIGGPLHVADLRTVNPLSRAFVEAGAEVGLRRNADFNGPELDGVGVYQVTQKRGRRHSAAAAYLQPIRGRPNLTIRTRAHATRIVFDGARASGVRYVAGGREQEAEAAREVILCGGAVNSPQLLLLSGVGPADHLRGLGIPVVADLPGVGQNLQDHLAMGVVYRCKEPITLASAETLGNLLRYIVLRRGPLTSNVAEAGGFMRLYADSVTPDVQFHFGPVFYVNHGFTTYAGHAFSGGPALLHPQSRGSITLRSADPLKPPAIQPNYLAAEEDLATLVEGVKWIRRLLQARAFDRYRGEELYPGADAHDDAGIADAMRRVAETLYHPVGTCRMGNDPMAVVGSRLQVHGVDGLRVVDASVMPTITSGNTNAPVIMIAERAADWIRERG
jgi:choline dehydrogenase